MYPSLYRIYSDSKAQKVQNVSSEKYNFDICSPQLKFIKSIKLCFSSVILKSFAANVKHTFSNSYIVNIKDNEIQMGQPFEKQIVY